MFFVPFFAFFSTFVKDECLFTLFMPRQDRMSKPKPERYNYTGAVACGLTPMTDHPDQKKWYDYGRETGLLTLRYLETKDVTLLPEIMQRCETEANAWLGMDPPDYAGAAKQWVNLEGHRFVAGCDKAAIQEATDKTNEYIRLSGAWQERIEAARAYNREQESLLACCAMCGKCTPQEQKRLFCGQCKWAVYCGAECQKQHWQQGHKELCGKQAHCAACFKLLEVPMKCTRCNAVWYCNKAHQTWHWKKGHKRDCMK